jgi:hypothetical protein
MVTGLELRDGNHFHAASWGDFNMFLILYIDCVECSATVDGNGAIKGVGLEVRSREQQSHRDASAHFVPLNGH